MQKSHPYYLSVFALGVACRDEFLEQRTQLGALNE
jgi:hypothetical protein